MPNSLLVEALNLYDTINIKNIRSLFEGRVMGSNPNELQLQYGETSFLIIYRFGCLVFFNMDAELRNAEIRKLKEVLGPEVSNPTAETYLVTVAGPVNKVEFEFVELKKFSIDAMRLISVTIGQSAALEYFETQAERMLREITRIMGDLAKGQNVSRLTDNKLRRMIGSTASTRQHIISNISILDPPDETWKSKELEKLFHEVQENFDIDMRFRVLDRKLSLMQDNIEILVDLTSTRRSTLLEFLIMLLIVMELFVAILFKFH